MWESIAKFFAFFTRGINLADKGLDILEVRIDYLADANKQDVDEQRGKLAVKKAQWEADNQAIIDSIISPAEFKTTAKAS